MNKLYYGDNLDVLKRSIEDESIDLIYIDPPFNSKRAYNVLFESLDMTDTKAQKEAFADTWSNVIYLDEMREIQDLDLDLFRFLETLDRLRISKGAVSYLTIMAHRIYYMHKKLKKTGSFYLHCDPTMSHYLKIVCDLIFGARNFRNEIIWHYSGWNKILKDHFERRSDTILFYTKSSNPKFNSYSVPWTSPEEYIKHRKQKLRYDDKKRPFVLSDAGEGKRTKRYIDEAMKYGKPVDNVWNIDKLTSSSKERLDYATQKPEALLERIIEASSKKNDLVADFFCGCGTTIAVAQKLNRRWIGVDISHLAIRLVINRLLKPYEGKKRAYKKIKEHIEINGFPKDIASAKELATSTDKSRLKFQDWIVEIMMNGVSNPKRTADGGYDGYITFNKSEKSKDVVLIEVKSGSVTVKNIREFVEVVNKEKASFGAFVCFADQVTKPMREWAKKAGYYKPDLFKNRYPKIQIITIEDLLAGETVDYPLYQNLTFKSATNINPLEEDNSISLFD